MGNYQNMEGACSAWLRGISDTSMPTVHFVGAYVNSHSTFQVANVPKDRPAYSRVLRSFVLWAPVLIYLEWLFFSQEEIWRDKNVNSITHRHIITHITIEGLAFSFS